MRWNNEDIPSPKTGGISVKHITVGSTNQAVNGLTRNQFVAIKRNIKVEWEGLTYAELHRLLDIHETLAGSPAPLSLPTNDPRGWNVFSTIQDIDESSWYSGGSREIPYYKLTINFREP